ncbi:purine permease 1 [Populus alba]|uniref:purine permease 1 n=1 Tax=Populus alba TaxID=43335 RepID=UPI001589B0B8|nr:purine permease 1-like [Populus alba]
MDTELGNKNEPDQHQNKKRTKAFLVFLNCMLMAVGQVAGPLLVRIYYLHGGKSNWLGAWLLTAGFPILIIPIAISYMRARARAQAGRLLVTPWLFSASVILGLLLGLDSYLYSFGMSYLPVSVSSILGSSQLAFTAIFAYIVVKHKFTHYSINAVVLMTFGSVILGFHMNGDRPRGESKGKYILGFFMTIGGAALHGFLMPALEFTYLKAGKAITFDLVLQVQFLISMFATLFCSIPMIINKDFKANPKRQQSLVLVKQSTTPYY